jgi:hypothetical protein
MAGILLYVALSRASMLAAAVAVIALCASLRRKAPFARAFVGVFVLACAAVLNPTHFDNFVSSVTSEILYKGKHDDGVLGSRASPAGNSHCYPTASIGSAQGSARATWGNMPNADRSTWAPSKGGLYTKEGTNRETWEQLT